MRIRIVKYNYYNLITQLAGTQLEKIWLGILWNTVRRCLRDSSLREWHTYSDGGNYSTRMWVKLVVVDWQTNRACKFHGFFSEKNGCLQSHLTRRYNFFKVPKKNLTSPLPLLNARFYVKRQVFYAGRQFSRTFSGVAQDLQSMLSSRNELVGC